MNDNVIQFPQADEVAEQKAMMVKWLRDLADVYEGDEGDSRIALAVFAAQDGKTAVQVGGFRSDSEAMRYFSAWIKQHGVA